MRRGKIIKSILILAVLLAVFYFTTNSITKYTGFSISDIDNDFEKCLEEEDITLYIKSPVESPDPIEALNNLKTKDYLMHVEVVDCLLNKFTCDKENIESFPTWVIDGVNVEGDISVEELSEVTGCEQ